jgi:NADH:ubiquinone oxidoreductase subunit 2 (subunit N)
MHESLELNPLILALIGIPTVLGFYFRFFRFNESALEINTKISMIVYLTIAIGYCFVKFDNPNYFLKKIAY